MCMCVSVSVVLHRDCMYLLEHSDSHENGFAL